MFSKFNNWPIWLRLVLVICGMLAIAWGAFLYPSWAAQRASARREASSPRMIAAAGTPGKG